VKKWNPAGYMIAARFLMAAFLAVSGSPSASADGPIDEHKERIRKMSALEEANYTLFGFLENRKAYEEIPVSEVQEKAWPTKMLVTSDLLLHTISTDRNPLKHCFLMRHELMAEYVRGETRDPGAMSSRAEDITQCLKDGINDLENEYGQAVVSDSMGESKLTDEDGHYLRSIPEIAKYVIEKDEGVDLNTRFDLIDNDGSSQSLRNQPATTQIDSGNRCTPNAVNFNVCDVAEEMVDAWVNKLPLQLNKNLVLEKAIATGRAINFYALLSYNEPYLSEIASAGGMSLGELKTGFRSSTKNRVCSADGVEPFVGLGGEVVYHYSFHDGTAYLTAKVDECE
jgi:hypothetical protein